MPNVKDVFGTMEVNFGNGYIEVEKLDLNGKGFEVLGWVHLRDKKADGRLYAKHGILAAGIALEPNKKGKVILSKPRKWFEEQEGPKPTTTRDQQ